MVTTGDRRGANEQVGTRAVVRDVQLPSHPNDEHAPTALRVGAGMVDLEGHDGAVERGPELRTLAGTKHDLAIHHRVVDREDGWQGAHRHAHTAKRDASNEAPTLVLAEDL